MRGRYLGILRPSAQASPRATRAVRSCFDSIPGFECAIDTDRLSLGVAGTLTLSRLPDGGGAILGSLFSASGAGRIETLGRHEAQRITASHGKSLLDRYWGGYVAILPGAGGRTSVLRAPFGELPCYFITADDAVIVASDVALLIATGLVTPQIDWSAIAIHLGAREVHHPETCLDGVTEITGGRRLTLDPRDTALDDVWSPWMFAGTDRRIEDPGEATRLVRDAVLACVSARAAAFDHILLMLSGGLDSSIVAAALAHQERPFTCLNLVTRDTAGDERVYARSVAAAFHCVLLEHLRDPTQIDFATSLAARLPRPSARAFSQETARAAAHAAATAGADAIFNGGGGDNVFCSLQSAAPAADRLLTSGPGAAFRQSVVDLALLASASVWQVTMAAVNRAWIRGPAFRAPRDIQLLARDAAGRVADAPIHPWLRAPRRALPGQASHIALLTFAQSYVESVDPQDPLPTVLPLLAQPVVEACLRIPSWLWLGGGQNRLIARRAFAQDLPARVADRRSKGSPNIFSAELFDANRSVIRDLLLGGELAAHGIIDPVAVSQALGRDGPLQGEAFYRLLQLADVEAWTRAWA